MSQAVATSSPRPNQISNLCDDATNALTELPSASMEKVARFAFRHMTALDVVSNWKGDRRMREVIHGHRETLAVDTALRTVNDGNDVTLVWGASHLPGFIRLLGRQGFALEDGRWIDVARFS